MGYTQPVGYNSDLTNPTGQAFILASSTFATANRTVAALTANSFGSYDPRRYAYNFKSSNTRLLRAGLGRVKAGTGFLKLGMCGDSTTAGFNTDPRKSASINMRDYLVTKGYPIAGTGPVIANSGGSTGGYYDPRYTTTGTWTTQAGNSNGIRQSNIITSTLTFTSDQTGTVVEISYLDLGAGFSYSIDGAGAVTIPGSAGTSTLARITVTALTNAVHTVLITVNNIPGGGAFYLNWVDVHSAISGISVGNFGVNGTATVDWLNTSFYYPQLTMINWNPDVIFIDLGINDWGPGGTPNNTPAAFSANTQSIITAFKSAARDVILVTSNPYNGVDYLPYNTVKYQLADVNDIPLIDIYQLFESYAISNPLGLYSDSAHPSLIGYAEKGNALANAIT